MWRGNEILMSAIFLFIYFFTMVHLVQRLSATQGGGLLNRDVVKTSREGEWVAYYEDM